MSPTDFYYYLLQTDPLAVNDVCVCGASMCACVRKFSPSYALSLRGDQRERVYDPSCIIIKIYASKYCVIYI